MKIVKTIKVDLDKCNGCRACEVACSAFHASPKYSSNNPARARIRVIHDPLRDVYVPIRAGYYTPAECTGRHTYTILPLKCDMCESDPPLAEPMCVQWCLADALTYEEREEEAEEEVKLEDMEIGLESMVDKYGLQKVVDAIARISTQE